MNYHISPRAYLLIGLLLVSAVCIPFVAQAITTSPVTMSSFNGPWDFAGGFNVQPPVKVASVVPGEIVQLSASGEGICQRGSSSGCQDGLNGGGFFLCDGSNNQASTTYIAAGFYNNSNQLIQEVKIANMVNASVIVPAGATSVYVYFRDSNITSYDDNTTGPGGAYTCTYGANITGVACSSNSDCGSSVITGSPFCQNGNVYQNYVSHTCNNPGTTSSSCVTSNVAQLQINCSSAQTCQNGSCTTNCTPNTQKQCVGNSVYNFDSCGAQGNLFQQCASNQTCSNGSCVDQTITCTASAQCGASSISGSPFCQSNGVYQNYTTHTCNNPGTASSYCSASTSAQLQTNCSGSQTCTNGSCTTSCTPNTQKQCVGNSVYWYNSCGTQGSLFQQCSASQTCQNAQCVNNQPITCSSASQCGSNSLTGSPFCQGSNVYQNYTTYTCNHPGTPASFCSNSTSARLQTNCTGSQACTNGSCTNSCTPNVTKQCVGNSVYNVDSCGVQGTLYQQCNSNQACTNGACVNQAVTCTTSTQCGTNALVGSPFCQGSNVYQNYITYTCNNAGTSSSYCSNSTSAQLQTNCTGSQTCTNGSCSANQSNINVSCYATPNPATTNQSVSFICNVSGGNGSYTYNWSGACTGSSATCTTTFANSGTQTANVLVTSGTQTNSASASVVITSACTQNSYQRCNGNYLYWYDSCGVQGSQSQYCPNGCSGSACLNPINTCTPNATERCLGNNLYWYDSCGAQGSLVQYCPNGCSGSSCVNNYNTCIQNSYQRCNGNYLYSYDSCGNQQSQSQYCPNGCSGNVCINTYINNYPNNNYSPYGNCTYHAYQLCSGNNLYWYDSCGDQQDFVQSCSGNNTVCRNSQCVYQPPVVITYNNPVVPPPTYNPYVAHYKIACYSNNLYWYDTLGSVNSLYETCADTNSCTLDSCTSSRCSNVVKCDGSTCAVGSPDYNSYCANNSVNTNTNSNTTTTGSSPVSIAFFAKQDSTSTQWQKSVTVGSNGQLYFMVSVVDNSAAEVNNVNVSSNIPSSITSLGNLEIDGVPVSGDIVAGISVGSLTPGSAKSITFEGKTESITMSATQQATATVTLPGNSQSDSLSINLVPGQAAAASVSSSTATSGFWAFLKRWYLWILVALVLIFLFIVVFRRLSNNE